MIVYILEYYNHNDNAAETDHRCYLPGSQCRAEASALEMSLCMMASKVALQRRKNELAVASCRWRNVCSVASAANDSAEIVRRAGQGDPTTRPRRK